MYTAVEYKLYGYVSIIYTYIVRATLLYTYVHITILKLKSVYITITSMYSLTLFKSRFTAYSVIFLKQNNILYLKIIAMTIVFPPKSRSNGKRHKSIKKSM